MNNKHLFRFLAEPGFGSDKIWIIDNPDEIHYLRNVLRLESSSKIELFDNQGQIAYGTIICHREIKKAVNVKVESIIKVKIPSWRLSIALACLKSATMDQLLPMLVELGTHDIMIFAQKKTPKHLFQGEKLRRWKRILLAATKQCKRPIIPKIHIFSSLAELFKKNSIPSERYFLDKDCTYTISQVSKDRPSSTLGIVGSENGFDLEEIDLLKKFEFIGVSLGPWILRAKTAAILWSGILSQNKFESDKNLFL